MQQEFYKDKMKKMNSQRGNKRQVLNNATEVMVIIYKNGHNIIL